jgi:hypothetical protein
VGRTYSIFLQIDRIRYAPQFVHPTRLGHCPRKPRVRLLDFFHGQTGVAANEIELHPILGFRPGITRSFTGPLKLPDRITFGVDGQGPREP